MKLSPSLNRLPSVISAKTNLFKSMHDFKTPPRILELGGADRHNLVYYPKGSSYLAIEPNEELNESVRKRVNEFGAHLKFDGVYVDCAEKLSHVEDESVDAYVMTHVTCSVKDMDDVLNEAHRVLKPGGRLYIFHHFLGPNANHRTPRLLAERWLLFPIAGRIMECDYDRYIEADIRRHFPRTDAKVVEIPYKLITLRCHLITESVKN